MPNSPPKVLLLGLHAPPNTDVQDRLMKGLEVTPQSTYDWTMHQFYIEQYPTPLFEQLEEIAKSQKWDGVIIGWGLRGTASSTYIFEGIVNKVLKEFPGVKLGFNSSVDDLGNALIRGWGPEKKE